MHWLAWLLIFVLGWSAWAWVSRMIMRNPVGDPISGIVYRFIRVYSAIVHRVRVTGRENIPRERVPGALLVVCNHTAGIDPLLVQAACPFYVQWMMARDMMWSGLADIWDYFDFIIVDREKPDSAALREAVRSVRAGNVVGIFPEGKIERPPGELKPFQAGVGAIVSMSGVRVLPIVIRGTPIAETAWASLWKTSKSELVVGEMMHFERGVASQAVVSRLEAWFLSHGLTRNGDETARANGSLAE